jgi:hypothetical protein
LVLVFNDNSKLRIFLEISDNSYRLSWIVRIIGDYRDARVEHFALQLIRGNSYGDVRGVARLDVFGIVINLNALGVGIYAANGELVFARILYSECAGYEF